MPDELARLAGAFGSSGPRRLEAAKLLPIHGVVLALRAGEMAHDEPQLDAVDSLWTSESV